MPWKAKIKTPTMTASQRMLAAITALRELVRNPSNGKAYMLCRPMRCAMRRSPCCVDQLTNGNPGPPSGAPTV